MSEFKGTKSYEYLVNENKEMLKMFQHINRKMCVTFDDLLEIKQLIKQATEL